MIEIDVRIRRSHLDTDEEHVVIERVLLPDTALAREHQLRELTLMHLPNADQQLYNHDEGKSAFIARPWLVVTMYLWDTKVEVPDAVIEAGSAMTLFGE